MTLSYGGSDLLTRESRIALGTVQFGAPYGVTNTAGQVPLKTARAMVQFAKKNGIGLFDTAIGYGDSERVLGQIGLDGIKVVTKLLPLPASVTDAYAWAMNEIDASLARLQVDQLYGVLLHRSTDFLGPQGVALHAAMRELQREGKVRKIGVSIYSPTELDALDGAYMYDLIQAPFNIFDQRLVTSGWLKKLKVEGCEIHVRSVFLQGLLLMRRNDIPAKFERWALLWNRWHDWLSSSGTNALHACLAYPLSFPEIDRVVVGALNMAQLRQITLVAEQDFFASPPDFCCEEDNLINPTKWSAL